LICWIYIGQITKLQFAAKERRREDKMGTNLIPVISATGTVGSEVTRHLIESGQQVRVIVRDRAKAANFGAAADVVAGDLLTPESLGPAFSGVERVFVVAPPTPDLETIEANAFDAAKKAGARHNAAMLQ
jgi:uncharacterized protein YbjT (DUF2867 family)